MKNKLLLAALSLVCVSACAFSLAACKDTNEPSAPPHTEHNWSAAYINDPDGDRHYQTCSECGEWKYGAHDFGNGNCICGKEKPTSKPATVPKEAFEDFIARMGANDCYSYTYTENGRETWYKLQGDKIVVDEYKYFLSIKNGVTYKYTYNNSDTKYHKTVSEEPLDVDSYILSNLKKAELTAYDEASSVYTVAIDGKTWQMMVSEAELVLQSGAIGLKVENIDNVTVQLPIPGITIDETGKPPVGPTPPVEPDDPVVEEKIYTVNAQGERVYNSKLLAQTIKEALNSEVSEDKTLYSHIYYGAKMIVDDVLFVSTQGENIILGAKVNAINSDAADLNIFTISKSSVESYADKKQDWVSGLLASGKQMKVQGVRGIDFKKSEENKAQLTEIFERVLNKYATDGLQSQSVNKKGTPVPRFENSQVLCVYEYAGAHEGSAGLDMGYTHHIGLVGVVLDKNGSAVFLDLGVRTTDFVSAYDTILNTNNSVNNKFVVYEKNRQIEVDKELYMEETAETAKTIQTAKEAALPAGKSKE